MILASLDVSCQNAKSQFSNAKLKICCHKKFWSHQWWSANHIFQTYINRLINSWYDINEKWVWERYECHWLASLALLSTFYVLVSKYAVVFLGTAGEQIYLGDECTHWQLNGKWINNIESKYDLNYVSSSIFLELWLYSDTHLIMKHIPWTPYNQSLLP
jgi:hypothetical protein